MSNTPTRVPDENDGENTVPDEDGPDDSELVSPPSSGENE